MNHYVPTMKVKAFDSVEHMRLNLSYKDVYNFLILSVHSNLTQRFQLLLLHGRVCPSVQDE